MNIEKAKKNFELWRVRFRDVTQNWLLYKKHKVKESTYLNYKYIVNTYLDREFGRTRIINFLTYDLNEFIDSLKDNLSNKTIRDIMLVLKSILKFTERKYNINFNLELITIPSSKSREIQIFTEKEIKKIERLCINSCDIRTLGVLISIYTGMRIGEVCALKWENIDLNKRLIHVTKTLQRVYLGKNTTKVIITDPKTKTSERKIPIPQILYNELKKRSNCYSRSSYVITGNEKKYIEPRTYQYIYRGVLTKAKVKYKNFHSLRHSFATRCISVGMDMKSLSEVLGHSDVKITLNRYVHSSYDSKKKFMEKI